MKQAAELLAIAGRDDTWNKIRIADAIVAHVRDDGALPDPDRVRKMVRAGHDPVSRPPTVGEWLEDQWLPGKKNLRKGTVRSYAAHIRLYYKPAIGGILIDRLRVTDVASVFDTIDEQNELILECRGSEDPVLRAKVKGMRVVGPATKQRIRATLRSALGSYLKQHPACSPSTRRPWSSCPRESGPGRWCGPRNASAPGSRTSRTS